jgi:glutathione S-transferase
LAGYGAGQRRGLVTNHYGQIGSIQEGDAGQGVKNELVAAQALARQENEIVAGTQAEPAHPVEHRRRIGCVADRDQRLPGFRQSLGPLRSTLETQPFLGGEAPLYADYIVFGAFQWTRCISDYAVLAADDPIAPWRRRMLDLFDGMGAKAKGYAVA